MIIAGRRESSVFHFFVFHFIIRDAQRYRWKFLVGKFAVYYRAFGYKPYPGRIGLADGGLEEVT